MRTIGQLGGRGNAVMSHIKRKSPAILLIIVALLLFGNTSQIYSHGGEDHGDEKPTTTASDKGTILRLIRLGDFEIMLKHPLFLPDTATVARLFVTKFETNEPIDQGIPVVEIESANGVVTEALVEKTDAAGSYILKIPALAQGSYTVRAKVTFKGETDTATFSEVEVKKPSVSASENGTSWIRNILIGFVFVLVLAMFAGLVYFVLRFSASGSIKEEPVSA